MPRGIWVNLGVQEMASKRPFAMLTLWAVCHDVLDRPVVLLCGHSSCRVCIEKYWSVSDSRQCPMCRHISANTPSLNLALGNLCQAFLQHKRHLEELCEVHQEKWTLVCCEDEQILCEICRQSEEHRNHTYRPVQEVVEQHKVSCRCRTLMMLGQLLNVECSNKQSNVLILGSSAVRTWSLEGKHGAHAASWFWVWFIGT